MSAAVMQIPGWPAHSANMPPSPTKRVTGFELQGAQMVNRGLPPNGLQDPTMSPPQLNEMGRSLSDSAVPRTSPAHAARPGPPNKGSSPLANPHGVNFDASPALGHMEAPPHSAATADPQHPKLVVHQHSHSWSAPNFQNNVTASQFQASPYQPSEVYTPPGSFHDGGHLFSNYSVQSMADPFYGSLPANPMLTARARTPTGNMPAGGRQGPGAPAMGRRASSSGSTHTSPEQPTLDMAGAGQAFQPASYHPGLPAPDSLFGGDFDSKPTLRPRSGAAMMAASAPPDFDLGMPPSISAAHRRRKGPNAIEEGVHKQLDVATEKKRKRRESHNLVERRRRDGINTAIQQLAQLLPEQLLEPIGTGQTTHHTHHKTNSTASVASVLSNSDSGPGTPNEHTMSASALSALRPNKSVVLQRAVEYMAYLKQLVEVQTSRNQELESVINDLQRHQLGDADPSAFSFAHAQSTEALFEDDPMQTQ